MKLTIEIVDTLDGQGFPTGEVQVQIGCEPPIKEATPMIGAVAILDHLLWYMKQNKEQRATGQEEQEDENFDN